MLQNETQKNKKNETAKSIKKRHFPFYSIYLWDYFRSFRSLAVRFVFFFCALIRHMLSLALFICIHTSLTRWRPPVDRAPFVNENCFYQSDTRWRLQICASLWHFICCSLPCFSCCWQLCSGINETGGKEEWGQEWKNVFPLTGNAAYARRRSKPLLYV